MFNSLKHLSQATLAVVLLVLTATVASAQVNTSGTVSISGTVSKFVELNSGGAVTLAGNSGGGVSSDGVSGDALNVILDLGQADQHPLRATLQRRLCALRDGTLERHDATRFMRQECAGDRKARRRRGGRDGQRGGV